TASDGVDANHRHYVLESVTADPQAEYRDRGPVDPGFDAYAIDGSVLSAPDGALYFLYTTGSLRIAPMSSPCRVSEPGVTIAAPSLPWAHGWLEAPQALIRAQPFTWTKEGTPYLGRPIPPGVPIPSPSGESRV